MGEEQTRRWWREDYQRAEAGRSTVEQGNTSILVLLEHRVHSIARKRMEKEKGPEHGYSMSTLRSSDLLFRSGVTGANDYGKTAN